MSRDKLRGASRREFVQGAIGLGAALGWGPTKIWEFIDRGGAAQAACDLKTVKNLVVLVGGSGSHGYITQLFPQPEIFTANRTVGGSTFSNAPGEEIAMYFMQNANLGGSARIGDTYVVNGQPRTATALREGVKNEIDYTNPMREDHKFRGKWEPGERYKRIYGVDNQGFRGFQSADATSRMNDVMEWGSDRVPSNVGADKAKNFIVATRETPFIHRWPNKAVTAIAGGGINRFHVNGSHTHFINYAKRQSVFAAAAAIQLARPTIVPVIMVGNMDAAEIEKVNNVDQYYGSATIGNQVAGQPPAAFVNDAAGMVALFSSNAARAGGALADPRNALLYEAFTKGFIGDSKSAQLPSFRRGYAATKLGANLVGLDLSQQLKPNDDDLIRYGYTNRGNNKYTQLRDKLIVTAKALKLGLTSQVVMNYFLDDPHGAFSIGGQTGGGDTPAFTGLILSNLLNAFMDDLMSAPDPFCPDGRTTVGDNTIIVFIGDVQRTQINRRNWNDPTVGGENMSYIIGNGLLKTGFFGGERPRFKGETATNNEAGGQGPGEGGLFDPRTGDMRRFTNRFIVEGSSDNQLVYKYGELAMAAVLYAVSGGDHRRVNDYYSKSLGFGFEEATALYNQVII